MENINLNPGWEKLYNLNFPTAVIDTSTASGLETNSIVLENAPSVSSNSTNGNSWSIGKKIIIYGGLAFLLYLLYRRYRPKEERER